MGKYTGSNSLLGRVAAKVNRASGGQGLSDYFGGKGTKKGALKSAGKVALTVGTLGAGMKVKAGLKAGKAVYNTARYGAPKVVNGLKTKAGRVVNAAKKGPDWR